MAPGSLESRMEKRISVVGTPVLSFETFLGRPRTRKTRHLLISRYPLMR